MKLPTPKGLKIVHYPDPVLKRIASPVTEFGPELRAFADRLLTLMREGKGVGLAAPQVGVSIRLFVCNATGEPGDDVVCVNPVLKDGVGQSELEEGCLSIPGVTVNVRRATKIVMQAVDLQGQPFELVGSDLAARIWQHETDHLDGRLIIDRMSEADELANRKALKQLKADYRPPR